MQWSRNSMEKEKRDAKDIAEVEQIGFDPWSCMREGREKDLVEGGVLRGEGKPREAAGFRGER